MKIFLVTDDECQITAFKKIEGAYKRLEDFKNIFEDEFPTFEEVKTQLDKVDKRKRGIKYLEWEPTTSADNYITLQTVILN